MSAFSNDLDFPKGGSTLFEGMPFPKVAMYKFGLSPIRLTHVPLLKAQRPIQKPGARCGIWHFFLGEFGYALIGPNGLAPTKKRVGAASKS